MKTIRILRINSIRTTRWERMIGRPYRRQRKQIRELIHQKQIDVVLTVSRIAEELGELGIPYLYKKKLVYRRGGIRRNPRKEWHMAILDDETYETEELLQRVSEDFNHLSIVTNRGEHFLDLSDLIYEETGLVLQITGQIPAKANIILDMKP